MYSPPSDLYLKLSPLLQEELEIHDHAKLRKQLAQLEVLRYELTYTREKWHEKLSLTRAKMRMPKSTEHTEFDRKIMLDGVTADIERDYEFLLSLETIISERIQLGMTFLQTM